MAQNMAQTTELHSASAELALPHPSLWTCHLVRAPFLLPIVSLGSSIQPSAHSFVDYPFFAASGVSLPLPGYSPLGPMPSPQPLAPLRGSREILGPDFYCLRQCVSQMVSRCGLGLVTEDEIDQITADASAHLSGLFIGYINKGGCPLGIAHLLPRMYDQLS